MKLTWPRVFWTLLAIAILLLMIAPLASYCLGRDQDFDDDSGLQAPHPAYRASAVVTEPLIR